MSDTTSPEPGATRPAKRSLAFWYGTFFGSGLFPVAPGTAGTVASLVLWAPVVLLDLPWWGRLLLAIFIFLTGVPAASACSKELGKEDPKEVVIDEVAGQGFALVFAPASFLYVGLGFVLFRLFDIWKPWPVRWADRSVHGGLGIMLDDVIAGIYAAGVLFSCELFLPNNLAFFQ